MAETKKTITVNLHVPEIIYDIQNKTHLTGISRKSEGSKDYEAAANMQASDDDEHSYQIRRSISNAYAHLKVELGEYLTENSSSADNLINTNVDADTKLTLTFSMPSNYNQSAVESLGKGLHEYIVTRAIADWFTITNKADADDYHALAKLALDTTRQAFYKRSRPTRPTYIKQ